MKQSDKAKLQGLTTTELTKKLTELQVESAKTKHELKLGKLKNTKTARNLRYQIAFIKTLITQKQTTKGNN